ncbi:hypothetical protein DQ04_00981050 [Trypanosoma grayi]|uniref:hypothetical protein n=1 Tax=Trypanosoma grayi TaxID=71804 RepID=UPI0004F4699D|nr:hypothetical protein DQ04_00981050 [Trypanosoma grayi]KEG13475.1 hypothetical protein DQ04_00981050 [Trypanosoma grayi]
MMEGGLSTDEELLLLQALFPYASSECLQKGIDAGKTVENAVHCVHAAANPDVYSAAYLEHERTAARAREEKGGTTNNAQQAFVGIRQLLASRLRTLEERVVIGISLHHEYEDAVGAFVVDTAAWDEHFLATATMTDVVGARPLTLPTDDKKVLFESGSVALTPIMRWAPSAAGLERERMVARDTVGATERLFKDGAGDCNGSATAAIGDTNGVASEKPDTAAATVPTQLQFSTAKVSEWDRIMESLAPWSTVFGDADCCALCKEVTVHCRKLADVIPELIPKVFSVIEKELKQAVVLSAARGVHVSALGGILLDHEAVQIKDIVFGRSYGVFDDDGAYLRLRVKIRRLLLEPLAFSYRKARSGGGSTSGVLHAKVKKVKIKSRVDVRLYAAGFFTICCRDTRVTIGALRTDCSVTKLHAMGIILRPIIKFKLREALIQLLSGDVVLGPT